MRKGNLAVFITGWDRDAWKLIIEGIQTKAKECGYSITIFNCAGSTDVSRRFDVGEFNIFRLCNFDIFDGVIIAANTIISKEIEQELFQTVKGINKPTISLEVREDGLWCGGIDNYKAMRSMVEHLLDFHKYERIGFVTGPDENQESILRLKAYLDVLAEHGVEIDEKDIFHGNYEFQSGMFAADYFANLEGGVPRAVVCANDDMAMGLIRGFEKHGIKVPKDVAVTGFDDTVSAGNFEPRISSVERPKKDLGNLACQYIIDAIEGKEQTGEFICETKPIFRESCGCWIRGGKSYKEFRHEHFMNMEDQAFKSAILDEMAEALTDCDNFDELLQCLKPHISFLNSEGFYLCIDPAIQKRDDVIDSPEFMGTIQKYEKKNSIEYSDRSDVLAAYRAGEYFIADSFDTKDILPACEMNADAKTYLLSPVHFQDSCMGYSIVVNPDLEMCDQYYYQWMMNINIAIENIRRKNMVNITLRRLEEMYIRDGLTNLYNRFGFERFSKELYQKSQAKSGDMLIMFADLDDLKHINDGYGHEHGDIAIKAIAEALIATKKESDICSRFGGDEFIMIGLGHTDESANEMIQQIDRILDDFNETHDYPYKVSVSIGFYILEEGSDVSLEDAIDNADANMYRAKQKKTK